MFTLLIPLIFLVVAINGLLVPKSLSPIRSNLMLGSTHLLAESSAVTKEVTVDAADRKVQKHAIVCGAGPAGLLSAIMLAQKFPEKRITVYDRLEEPPSPTDESVWSDVAKFYLIGLGGRGQGALREFGVWDEVEKVCTATVGRRDWSPESSKEGMERIFTDRPVTTQVLPRDKLVGVMYQHILKNYANQIDLKFGCEVTPLDFEGGNDGTDVVVQVAKCKEIDRQNSSAKLATSSDPVSVLCDTENVEILTTKFLVAADGSARAFANAMEEADKQRLASMNPIQRLFAGKPFTVTRYVDDNQRIYKTVPFRLPEGWRPDLNYSARSKGSRITFDALPANRNGSYNGVLLVKKEDELAQEDMDPTRLREAFDEFLPQFSHLIDDETINVVAKKPPSYLPAFRYVSPRLYQGKRTVVLGDCIHTVKPYFGLGANSALEDVQVLKRAIEEATDLTEATRLFSKRRAGEAKALVRISRELDRPGKLGFVTFILPIILDAIFNKLAPKVFAPNVISMLQKQNYSFQRVAARKRQDRIVQVAIITALLASVFVAFKGAIGLTARLLGRERSTVLGGLFVLTGISVMARKLATYLVPGLAPADILNKTRSTVTGSSEKVAQG